MTPDKTDDTLLSNPPISSHKHDSIEQTDDNGSEDNASQISNI